jgi:hypothetical protein
LRVLRFHSKRSYEPCSHLIRGSQGCLPITAGSYRSSLPRLPTMTLLWHSRGSAKPASPHTEGAQSNQTSNHAHHLIPPLANQPLMHPKLPTIFRLHRNKRSIYASSKHTFPNNLYFGHIGKINCASLGD